MGISVLLNAPYFTGQSRSMEVPYKWDCSINGRGYMFDLNPGDDSLSRRSIPLLRNQANTGEQFGELSLNPEGLWRKSQDSWDHGAGQMYLDRQDSDPRRFRSSKGIDVWERWGMSLLPDTSNKRSSTNTNLMLQPVGTSLYLTDGAALLMTTSLVGTPTWTAVTGTPNAPTSITSDGFNVYTAHGGSGVYRTTRGAGSTTSFATGTVTLVGYVKGRLMAAAGASIYNITAAGALPTALFTQPNTDFAWVGFTDGQAAIYAAGFSGDKSLIYRITIRSDGTGLDVPIVAGELPDGEIVRSIGSYLGFILLGTDRGVRFCATDAAGNLTVGSLIKTPNAVLAFEGQDRFVWFGWSNYDSTSTGLGRLDLSTFIAPLTPAYASDLMATGQGAVTSVATFGNVRVFTVSGLGVFAQSSTLVPTGQLDTGLISYGLSDPKVAVYLDVRLSRIAGTNQGFVSTDGGEFLLAGTRSGTDDDEAFQVGQVSGENFEVRQVLTRSSTDATAGPVVSRYTLRSYPKPPARGEIFTVPLLLHTTVTDRAGKEELVDVEAEVAGLLGLQNTRQLVIFQIGNESHTVLVDDSVFVYSHRGPNGVWNGTHNLKMKGVV